MRPQRAKAPATAPAAGPSQEQGQLHAVGLLTDGLAECLTSSPHPTFTWQLAQPEEADPARAVQTGYEIALEDAQGTKFWSSGPVSSPARRGIPYDGPALEDDADYAWRVRVRDAAGIPGDWSCPQPFSTGLGDAEWRAGWIRRAPGGRSPLEVLNQALRVAGSPFLPAPCPPVRSFRLEARVRPVMGWAGLILRSTGPGTGLLLELNTEGEVVLRQVPEWEIPTPGVPETAVLAKAQAFRTHDIHQARLPGKDLVAGSWQNLVVSDDGATITVSLDGAELLAVQEPQASAAPGRFALHQGPRSQAEYASLRITGTCDPAGTDAVLLDHRFDASEEHARACLAHWASTTAHRQPDEWTLFRTSVELKGMVRRARLFVAANHHAQLSLAETHCLSTTSFGYPGEGYYDAADVTALLAAQPLDTPVPLTALLHWYGPGQGRAAGLPGLLVHLSVHYTDGRREVFGSGADWSAGEAPYRQSGYRNDEGDPVEHLDGQAAAALAAALSSAMDDMPAAISYGSHPTLEFPRVHPRRTFIADEFVAPKAFLTADDGTLVADFGQVLPGRPEVDFLDGVPGRTLMIRAGYGLRPDGRVDAGKTASQNTDMSFPYTQAAGPQQFRASVHLGFRYLELPFVQAADLSKVGAVVVHGRHPGEGSFSSSDATLDAVFKLLRDSALYGVQEQFVDTPTREKGQFLADAVNISYATMSLFGEHAYTAQALREFGWSAVRYWTTGEDKGRYNAVYPNGDGKRDIPDFSLMIPEWIEEYHLRTGDLALVRELLPHLCSTADYALRYIPAEGPTAGLVTTLGGGSGPYLHGIVDWPEPGRFGYDMECAAKTTVNVQAYSALMATARLCGLAGEEEAAIRYASSARQLADTIRTRLRVDGVMVDGLHADGTPSAHASQHATSFPLSLGITAPDLAFVDARRIAAMGMQQGPLTVHRLVRALLSQGLTDAVLDLLTNKDQPGWARLLERGATFTWEAWDLVEGTDYSQSHAWSASVVKEIFEHLLGVRYTSAAGAELLIEPPVCRLEHARGSVPAASGCVEASWQREGGLMRLECTIPPGVTAVVRLPAGSYAVASGREGPTADAAVVPPARESAGTARLSPGGETAAGGEKVDFRVHPGTWTFTPRPVPA
ncbi:family 78 glycoside hydrolase catalytic domain [Pseudarthrobacter sp. NamE5]|uniref:family 78 glycoside hydrolase catalytic domain n=1 Tax=Pseudarthrobacter sp. NamE5 TaxID=2576839 RepID=UPI00110BA3E3|nr:family 78 glycoside hydrolase catalytic domain [Pseudarthrobacter sp. NamE5]TLM84591.1 alpha-L-rhamnosidase [Pseudarthrobacter sp. NamE5]